MFSFWATSVHEQQEKEQFARFPSDFRQVLAERGVSITTPDVQTVQFTSRGDESIMIQIALEGSEPATLQCRRGTVGEQRARPGLREMLRKAGMLGTFGKSFTITLPVIRSNNPVTGELEQTTTALDISTEFNEVWQLKFTTAVETRPVPASFTMPINHA